jgi:hypothetical protein
MLRFPLPRRDEARSRLFFDGHGLRHIQHYAGEGVPLHTQGRWVALALNCCCLPFNLIRAIRADYPFVTDPAAGHSGSKPVNRCRFEEK